MTDESWQFCGQCGRALKGDARFCGFCGQAVLPDSGTPVAPGDGDVPGPGGAAGTWPGSGGGSDTAWPGSDTTRPGTWPGAATGADPQRPAYPAPGTGAFPAWPTSTPAGSATPADSSTADGASTVFLPGYFAPPTGPGLPGTRPGLAGPPGPGLPSGFDAGGFDADRPGLVGPDRDLGSTNPRLPALGPGAAAPAGTGEGRSRRPLVLGAVIVAVLVGSISAFLLLGSHASSANSGSPQATAAGQASGAPSQPARARPAEEKAARGLAALLARSGTDRMSIDRAVTDLTHCRSGLASDATTLRRAAASRDRLLSSLSALPGRTALPHTMTRDLAKAWKASAQADRDFAALASQESSGKCRKNNSHNSHLQATVRPDSRATIYKKDFVRHWNRLAARYGLRTYQWTQL